MSTQTEIINRARALLVDKSEFASDSSRFIDELSSMIGVGVDMAVFEAQTCRNESFTATAILESSLIAKASDEGRVPNRPVPQKIKCSITAKGGAEYVFEDEFESDIGTTYLIQEPVIVEDGTVYTEFLQVKKNIYTYQASGEDWQEVVVGSAKTAMFEVYVDGVPWENFLNVGKLGAEDKGYVTLFNILGQMYIRFGNGFLGEKPEGEIKIISYDTDSIDISVGAYIYPLDGSETDVVIQVTEILKSSMYQESALSAAKSLPIWRLSVGGTGMDVDYISSIKAQFPETIWAEAWGEKKKSQEYNRDEINIVFISALREENQAGFGVEVINHLETYKHVLQVEFFWKEPLLEGFSLTISGKVEKTFNIGDSEEALTGIMEKYHGLLSTDRRDRVIDSEISDLIKSANVFKNLLPDKRRKDRPSYSYDITGITTPSSFREVVYLQSINFNIEHIKNT